MLQYWWIPILIPSCILSAWLSVYAKDGWKWVIIMILLQLTGLWPFVARYSKNLAFDGILYDVLLLFCFFGTFIVMGEMSNLSKIQWAGFVLCVLGLLMMKGVFGK